jgi:hypothetical protein
MYVYLFLKIYVSPTTNAGGYTTVIETVAENFERFVFTGYF